ncbi:MAG: hypothetical protein ABII90_07230 [Bacteroidota bacterium]
MGEVHKEALKFIRSLNNKQLDEAFQIDFLGFENKRIVLYHAIRLEAAHAGHLGWICKLNGIKTI